jgi:hypothetical protein
LKTNFATDKINHKKAKLNKARVVGKNKMPFPIYPFRAEIIILDDANVSG